MLGRGRLRTAAIIATTTVAVTAATVVGAVGATAAPTAPINDNVGKALTLTPVSYDDPTSHEAPHGGFDATAATVQSSEPQPTGGTCKTISHTAWYSFTATVAQPVVIRGRGTEEKVKAELAVYSGALPSTQVGCSIGGELTPDDTTAQVSFNTVVGTKYWIQAGVTTTALGSIIVWNYFGDAPGANDQIAGASPLTNAQLHSLDSTDPDYAGGTYTYANLSQATIQENEPAIPTTNNCGPAKRSRWFSWVSTVNGSIDAVPLGYSNLELATWSGSDAPTTFEACTIADNDNVVRTNVTVGKKIWFQLATKATDGFESAAMIFTTHTKPVNDSPAAAKSLTYSQWLTGNGKTFIYDNTLATADSPELQPSKCTTGVTNSQWFKFTAPDQLYLYIASYSTFTGQPHRTGKDVIALWKGTNAPTTLVDCGVNDGTDDDPDSLDGTGPGSYADLGVTTGDGQNYWLQVAGTNGQAATGNLYFESNHLTPGIVQDTKNGVVVVDVFTSRSLQGSTVQFFRKSGLTGQVVPLGTAKVDANGEAIRRFNAKPGQILALYGKVLALNMVSQYTKTITFKVK